LLQIPSQLEEEIKSFKQDRRVNVVRQHDFIGLLIN